METIDIKYNIKKARLSGWLGLVFIVLGILSYCFAEFKMHVFTAMGIFNVAIAVYYLRWPYARINDEFASVGFKKIKVDNMRRVKYFAGDVTISDGKRELVINKDFVDPSSVENMDRLQEILREKCAENAINA